MSRLKTVAIDQHIAAHLSRIESVQPRAHKRPCKHCPSAHYPPDPESAEIATRPHAERVLSVFPCGWNGKRYCKGVCDALGVSDNDIAEATAAGAYK